MLPISNFELSFNFTSSLNLDISFSFTSYSNFDINFMTSSSNFEVSFTYSQCIRCRRLILSGLLYLFSFWASGPFVTSSNLSLEPCLWLIYQVVESFSISYFYVVFVSHLIIIFCKCHVCVRFVLCHCFSYLFTSNIILLFRN